MYRLYSNDKGKRLLDISRDEADIVDTLSSYMGVLDTIDYEITSEKIGVEETIAKIKSYDDYLAYKYVDGKKLIKCPKRRYR